jgi:hypothetical protein
MDEIDINDYELANEEVEYGGAINVLNIFTTYFKKKHSLEQNVTMFDNIDYDQDDSTNKCMEFIYEEMYKYKKSNEVDKDTLYDPDNNIDINTCKELYALFIENELIYICKYLVPLFEELAKNINWADINWSVMPLKN